MALAQKVGSNTLAMVEIAVIISASPRVSCFGRARPSPVPLDFVAVTTFGLVDRKNMFLAVRPGSLIR